MKGLANACAVVAKCIENKQEDAAINHLEQLCGQCWDLVKVKNKKKASKLIFPSPSAASSDVSLSRLVCNCLYLVCRCYLQQNAIQTLEVMISQCKNWVKHAFAIEDHAQAERMCEKFFKIYFRAAMILEAKKSADLHSFETALTCRCSALLFKSQSNTVDSSYIVDQAFMSGAQFEKHCPASNTSTQQQKYEALCAFYDRMQGVVDCAKKSDGKNGSSDNKENGNCNGSSASKRSRAPQIHANYISWVEHHAASCIKAHSAESCGDVIKRGFAHIEAAGDSTAAAKVYAALLHAQSACCSAEVGEWQKAHSDFSTFLSLVAKITEGGKGQLSLSVMQKVWRALGKTSSVSKLVSAASDPSKEKSRTNKKDARGQQEGLRSAWNHLLEQGFLLLAEVTELCAAMEQEEGEPQKQRQQKQQQKQKSSRFTIGVRLSALFSAATVRAHSLEEHRKDAASNSGDRSKAKWLEQHTAAVLEILSKASVTVQAQAQGSASEHACSLAQRYYSLGCSLYRCRAYGLCIAPLQLACSISDEWAAAAAAAAASSISSNGSSSSSSSSAAGATLLEQLWQKAKLQQRYSCLAACLREEGRMEEALEAATRAIAVDSAIGESQHLVPQDMVAGWVKLQLQVAVAHINADARNARNAGIGKGTAKKAMPRGSKKAAKSKPKCDLLDCEDLISSISDTRSLRSVSASMLSEILLSMARSYQCEISTRSSLLQSAVAAVSTSKDSNSDADENVRREYAFVRMGFEGQSSAFELALRLLEEDDDCNSSTSMAAVLIQAAYADIYNSGVVPLLNEVETNHPVEPLADAAIAAPDLLASAQERISTALNVLDGEEVDDLASLQCKAQAHTCLANLTWMKTWPAQDSNKRPDNEKKDKIKARGYLEADDRMSDTDDDTYMVETDLHDDSSSTSAAFADLSRVLTSAVGAWCDAVAALMGSSASTEVRSCRSDSIVYQQLALVAELCAIVGSIELQVQTRQLFLAFTNFTGASVAGCLARSNLAQAYQTIGWSHTATHILYNNDDETGVDTENIEQDLAEDAAILSLAKYHSICGGALLDSHCDQDCKDTASNYDDEQSAEAAILRGRRLCERYDDLEKKVGTGTHPQAQFQHAQITWAWNHSVTAKLRLRQRDTSLALQEAQHGVVKCLRALSLHAAVGAAPQQKDVQKARGRVVEALGRNVSDTPYLLSAQAVVADAAPTDSSNTCAGTGPDADNLATVLGGSLYETVQCLATLLWQLGSLWDMRGSHHRCVWCYRQGLRLGCGVSSPVLQERFRRLLATASIRCRAWPVAADYLKPPSFDGEATELQYSGLVSIFFELSLADPPSKSRSKGKKNSKSKTQQAVACSISSSVQESVTKLLRRGDLERKQGNHDKALAHYTAAERLVHDGIAAERCCLDKEGIETEACGALTALLGRIMCRQGRLDLMQGDLDAAKGILQLALAEGPKRGSSPVSYCTTLYYAGKTELLKAHANSDSAAMANARGHFCTAFNLLRSISLPKLRRRVCTSLALASECAEETAFFMQYAVGTTLHNQISYMLSNLGTKAQAESGAEGYSHSAWHDTLSSLLDTSHGTDSDSVPDSSGWLSQQLSYLPSAWTVVNMVLTQEGGLLVSRLQHGARPLVRHIPLQHHHEEVMQEFQAVMQESVQSMSGYTMKDAATWSKAQRAQWWIDRENLDKRLGNVLKRIEDDWLGKWRALLQGGQVAKELEQELAATAAGEGGFAGFIPQDDEADSGDADDHNDEDSATESIDLSSVSKMKVAELRDALKSEGADMKGKKQELVDRLVGLLSGTTAKPKAQAKARARASKTATSTSDGGHMILILGEGLQHLPWEGLPVLQGQSVSRMPSLTLLLAHAKMMAASKTSAGAVRASRTKYVINPSGDLKATEAALAPTFKEFGKSLNWKAVQKGGIAPTSADYRDALLESDLFVYCGHGNGEQYCHRNSIEKLPKCAVALLMGCSSGKLKVEGDYEGSGMVHAYIAAGCPAVVANLWDVSDKDIDRFLVSLLQDWIGAGSSGSDSLAAVLDRARGACKLKHLVGCSPVCYGVPVNLVEESQQPKQKIKRRK